MARLEAFQTLTPFSRGYYRLLAESVSACGPQALRLRRLFLLLLRIETRRHDMLSGLKAQDMVDVFNLTTTTRRARNDVQRVLRALMGTTCRTRAEQQAWQLLLAECRYLQGDAHLVVSALRRALALGGSNPLIQFALGYNLYCHAMRRYTRMDFEKQTAHATNPRMFVATCRQAIAAFRLGIGQGGAESDAQLYWWIGFICEILAEKQAARRSYREAARLDSTNYAEPARERLPRLRGKIRDAADARERSRLSRLPPITADELQETARMLSKLEGFPQPFET